MVTSFAAVELENETEAEAGEKASQKGSLKRRESMETRPMTRFTAVEYDDVGLYDDEEETAKVWEKGPDDCGRVGGNDVEQCGSEYGSPTFFHNPQTSALGWGRCRRRPNGDTAGSPAPGEGWPTSSLSVHSTDTPGYRGRPERAGELESNDRIAALL